MEYFDVLDEHGSKTGQTKARNDVHRDGDWHRTIHVWIVNRHNDILLQKRSLEKDTSPGMWDVSVGGHVQAGDLPLPTALRELEEELGLTVRPNELDYLFTNREKQGDGTALRDHEIHEVYLLRTELPTSAMRMQPGEVDELAFVPWMDVRRRLEQGDPTLVPHPEEYASLFTLFST